MAQRVRYSTDDEEPLVEFSILGPLEVTVGGRTVEVGRAKPRTVLAVLLIHVNQVVAVDRLSEALWGDDPPPSATNTLQGYVSHLRRILAADNAAGDPPVIRTQHPGYVLAAPPEAVDARRFQRLAADGRRALIGAEPQRAAETLAAALALWRGTALADFADQPFAIGEAARLEELRLAAEEDLTEAELALGLHGELVGRLRALTERHPLRERLWGQLMVALYREGRQGEALRAFQAARRALTDQLGIDPSPTLRQLEADILAQSPNLDWHRPASSVGPSMVAATGPHAAGRIIGRKDEMAVLEGDLRHAIDGAGRIVLVSGEPGIGKTRLVEELARNAVAAGAEVAWGRCYEGPAAAAFWPWMQVMTTLIDGGDEEMVRAALLPGAADIAQIVPQVKEVFPDLELPAVFDADAARCRLYEAVVRFLSRLATSRPLMLAAEDIHWADLPSLELLAVLASRIREARTLIVATFRDVDPLITSPLADTLADLARYPVVSRLELRGLDRPDVGRFLTELTGSQPAPDVVAAIHGRTEGNPFFVSELARLYNTTGDSGSAPSDDGAEVPVGVRDVVLRRVGRLPESTRGQLDVAAVMGREFELDVLFAVSGDDRETTLDLLEPAVRARLIEQSPELATHYRFSHALVSETIYDDLTPIARARLHLRVAQALEAIRQPDDEVHAVELAHHYYRALPAGPLDKAFTSALQAAQVAQAHLADEQAEEQLRRAVELARRMPIDQRSGRELDVQVRLFTLLMRRGYTAPGVGQASSRALELAQRAPDPLQVAASLVGVSVFSAVRSDYPTSHACGEQLVALGQRSGDSALQYVGHTVLAMVGFLRGDLAAAVDHHNLATAVDAFDEARLLALFGIHFPSNCRAFAAAAHWLRGERDESQRLISEAIDLATLPGREFSLANAMMHDTMLGAFEGDGNRALASADQAIELAHKFRFVLYEAGSSIVRGWARASLGDIAGGEAELEEWYAVTQEMHATCLRPFHQGLLADIRRSTGRTDAALETVERAIGFSQSAGDRFWEPELHRLRGELLASLPDRRQDAEESLREAIAVASSQGARALEARARQSLTLLSTPSKAARPKRS